MQYFKDLKVVELASVLAGPLVGSFFAELGATVVKIENARNGGDVTRQWRLPEENIKEPFGAYYAASNYGKKVVQMDLTNERDLENLVKLIVESDLVISNFQKKTAEKLSLQPQDLISYKEALVVIQLTAYSYDDPRPGYDLVMQAESGFISMNGTQSGELAKMPVALVDVIAGHQMKEAALIGLLEKERTGKGSIFEVSLFKSAISALANQASNYLMAGHVPKPIGTLHPNIAPYGDVFLTEDDISVILAIGSDQQFEKLGKTLNLAEGVLHTLRYNKRRVEERDLLTRELQKKIGTKSFSKLESQLRKNNIPFCRIATLDNVFQQALAVEMILEEEIEGIQTKKVSNIAFQESMI